MCDINFDQKGNALNLVWEPLDGNLIWHFTLCMLSGAKYIWSGLVDVQIDTHESH